MENLLMNYNGGLRFIKSTTVKNWNDVLSDAAARGHEGAVRLLLERDKDGNYIHKDINPGADDNGPIRMAAYKGHEGIVKLLLERDENEQYTHKDIDPGAYNNEAIRMAAAHGHKAEIFSYNGFNVCCIKVLIEIDSTELYAKFFNILIF